jgi:DNA-binding protein HU-beta
MKQSELIDHLVDATGLNRKEVKQFLDELSSLAHREVSLTGEFLLPGMGKLVRTQRRARQGRNPSTGEEIEIPARRTVRFRVGKSLKSAASGDNTTGSDI